MTVGAENAWAHHRIGCFGGLIVVVDVICCCASQRQHLQLCLLNHSEDAQRCADPVVTSVYSFCFPFQLKTKTYRIVRLLGEDIHCISLSASVDLFKENVYEYSLLEMYFKRN